jgi:predicted transcriptional regulator of viral defense system
MAEAGRKSGPYVHFRGQPPIDEAIAELAGLQHAVFSLDQLRDLGLSSAAWHKRAARGRLHRIHHRVYSLVPLALLTREGHWMAAVLASGPGAVLSYHKAAALHEILESNRARIDVTVPGRSGRRTAGIEIHRSASLTNADVTIVTNIPCTTVARTLFDLAEVVARRRLERACDQAEMQGLLDMAAIEDQLRRNPTRPAASKVRAVLEEHYIGSTATESEVEEAFLALCRRAGLPQPQVQHWLLLSDGGPPIRADFYWPEQRVVVEIDGEKYHGTRQARRRDARKDQRLLAHGFKPVRTGARQIFYRPDELEATLRALLCS